MPNYALYNKKKLCYTEVVDFTDFQGIGRDQLYKRYDSVNSVVEKYIKEEYRDFLAQPVYSEEDDQIQWFAREWTETPRMYKELSGDEKEKYSGIFSRTLSEYETELGKLIGEDKQILSGALKYIDEEFLFCYDNKVVLIGWGMTPDSSKHVIKGSVMHDLKIDRAFSVHFICGKCGVLEDKLSANILRSEGTVLRFIDVPKIIANEGYAFVGWEPDPVGVKVDKELTFTAQYKVAPVEEKIIDPMPEDPVPVEMIEYRFDTNGCGVLKGQEKIILPLGKALDIDMIPKVLPDKGYEFREWEKSQDGNVVTYKAQYDRKLSWLRRTWTAMMGFFHGKGCLKWLLWILLLILLLFLLAWLLRGCDSVMPEDPVMPVEKIETPSGDVIEDNGNGHVDDIVGVDGSLPDHSIIAPIVGEDGKVPIEENPGAPDIVRNRLNVYFEDANVDLDDFAVELKKVFAEDECSIVGIDVNIPMLQLKVKEEMREEIRESLNAKITGFEFFVLDESIFSIVGSDGTPASPGWHIDAVGLKEAWKLSKGSSNLIVAVVDDGIDASHRIFKNKIVKPYNVFTRDNRLSLGQGHGTHVAGLAVGSDFMLEQGVTGVAPNCRLMPIQVFDNKVCTFSSITSGIMYAIHNGASVVNVSIGPDFSGMSILPLPTQEAIADSHFKNEERVWRKILDVAKEKNVVIVFAAGNDDILACVSPENRTDESINVAAVDDCLNETDFTNFGKGANISAPGQDIISSVPMNKYAIYDGTSMAAPIVSGAVALMKSLKPDLSVGDILHILQATGKNVSAAVPPLLQIDDALLAVKTGKIPPKEETGDGADSTDVADCETPVEEVGKDEIKDDVIHKDPDDNTDYDAIRRLIEEYKKKIAELEKQLPENK